MNGTPVTVTVPAGVYAGQQFIALEDDDGGYLVTVPEGGGPGTEIQVLLMPSLPSFPSEGATDRAGDDAASSSSSSSTGGVRCETLCALMKEETFDVLTTRCGPLQRVRPERSEAGMLLSAAATTALCCVCGVCVVMCMCAHSFTSLHTTISISAPLHNLFFSFSSPFPCLLPRLLLVSSSSPPRLPSSPFSRLVLLLVLYPPRAGRVR